MTYTRFGASRRHRALAVLVAGSLAMTACGDDDDSGNASTARTEATSPSDDATEDTDAAAATTEAESATEETTAGGTDDTADEGATSGGSDSVPAIPVPPENTEGYGQDPDNPTLYRGAGGFELDTSECPSDWDPMQGITDDEIRLFTALPLSGPIASVGVYGLGIEAYFNYVNANGGIDGRNIVIDVNDNQYKPDLTKTIADEAIADGSYAGSVGINGTPMNLAIWDDMNAECMPALVTGSGAAEWGDVEGHPWTGPSQTFAYVAESRVQADFIKDSLPDGGTVVTITINNDFGKQYLVGLEQGLEGSNVEIVETIYHDPAAANLDNEFTTAEATNADVLVLQSAGTPCSQVLASLDRSAWDPMFFLPNSCGTSTIYQPVIDQGLTGEGAYLVQHSASIDDPSVAEEPFVQAYFEFMPTVDLDPSQTSYALGWQFGWIATHILAEAATYEGGLNRANIMLAHRNINTRLPLQFEGLIGRLHGTEDAYLYEGGLVSQYGTDDPSSFGVFEPVTDVIAFEGELGTFATFAQALSEI